MSSVRARSQATVQSITRDLVNISSAGVGTLTPCLEKNNNTPGAGHKTWRGTTDSYCRLQVWCGFSVCCNELL